MRGYGIGLQTQLTVSRAKRSPGGNSLEIKLSHEDDEFSILLRRNRNLITDGTVVEWHYANGTRAQARLDLSGSHKDSLADDSCFYVGQVR